MHFSNISSDNGKLAVSIGIGVGVVTAVGIGAYFYHQKLINRPPKKWRRVGEISDIICYPIKSCAPIRISNIECKQLGIENGNLRDRVFMVISPEGQFVTARSHPKMLQIQPHIDGDKMILSAPGMIDIEVNFPRLYATSPITASVWQQPVKAIDCGEEVAKWFSRFIHAEDTGFRLVFYPGKKPTRDCVGRKPDSKDLTNYDAGSLHDVTSYMMINEGSIAELNSRLDHVVTPLQFRPNFVVKGPLAFEEDSWKWVRIGKNVIFRNIKPCTRCIFTNIDPATAKRNPDFDPLRTLNEYRKIIPNDSPVMGIHLGVRNMGSVSIGDPVYVGLVNQC